MKVAVNPGLCANTNACPVVLGICPSDRSYHDWAGPTVLAIQPVRISRCGSDESHKRGSGGMLTRKDNPALTIDNGEGVASSGGSSAHEESSLLEFNNVPSVEVDAHAHDDGVSLFFCFSCRRTGALGASKKTAHHQQVVMEGAQTNG